MKYFSINLKENDRAFVLQSLRQGDVVYAENNAIFESGSVRGFDEAFLPFLLLL